MLIEKLGHKSKRRMTIEYVYSEGEVLVINGELYLCPRCDYGIDFDYINCEENDYVLVRLDTGRLEAFDGSVPCALVKDAKLSYSVENCVEWVEWVE